MSCGGVVVSCGGGVVGGGVVSCGGGVVGGGVVNNGNTVVDDDDVADDGKLVSESLEMNGRMKVRSLNDAGGRREEGMREG